MDELKGKISYDRVGYKCGMRGSIDFWRGTAHFNTNIGVHEGVFQTRSADQYGPNGEFITGPTPIIEGTLTVHGFGKTSPMKMNPETKEQYYDVDGGSADLKYRIGMVGGNSAINTAVWEPYVILTLTKANWGPLSNGLGLWTWSLEGAVPLVAVPVVEKRPDPTTFNANTPITIRVEIVGEGTVHPSSAKHIAYKNFDPADYPLQEGWVSPVWTTRLGVSTDFTFIPAPGWKCSGGVYLRPLSQQEGRTPEYKWGHAFSIDSLRTLKGNDFMADGKTPRMHLSIGPDGVGHPMTLNGDVEHILRVEFVPIDSTSPAYTGPTLDEMVEITSLKKQVKDLDDRLKIVEAK